MTRRPPWILPVIIFSQFAGTAIWFSGNAGLGAIMRSWSSPPPMTGWVTGAVQLGFIAGTLLFALFAVSDRLSPRRVFLVCAVAGALANLMTFPAGSGPAGLLILRFVTGFFLAGIYPVGMKIAAGWYQKGLGNALGLLIGALVLGTAFPHLLKGGLSTVSWQAVIAISSGFCLLGGLMMAALVPDGPHLVKNRRFHPREVASLLHGHSLRAAALGYFHHSGQPVTDAVGLGPHGSAISLRLSGRRAGCRSGRPGGAAKKIGGKGSRWPMGRGCHETACDPIGFAASDRIDPKRIQASERPRSLSSVHVYSPPLSPVSIRISCLSRKYK
jgi:MFS family permease